MHDLLINQPNDLYETFVTPDWCAPANVIAFTTTTAGGVSVGDCASLNLGTHVGDNPTHVDENRTRLQSAVGDSVQLCWLNQTHSDIIIDTNAHCDGNEGDAATSDTTNIASLVMTADCLPVLLCNKSGTRVAALHCGWRGLYENLIQKTLTTHFANQHVIAWLGPAIGPASYEVGTGLYERFTTLSSDYADAFQANRPEHYLFDLYHIARLQLGAAGILSSDVSGGTFDTFSDSRFFSHRLSAQSGRMASVIYLSSDM